MNDINFICKQANWSPDIEIALSESLLKNPTIFRLIALFAALFDEMQYYLIEHTYPIEETFLFVIYEIEGMKKHCIDHDIFVLLCQLHDMLMYKKNIQSTALDILILALPENDFLYILEDFLEKYTQLRSEEHILFYPGFESKLNALQSVAFLLRLCAYRDFYDGLANCNKINA